MSLSQCCDILLDHVSAFQGASMSCVNQANYAHWQQFRNQKTTLNLCDYELREAFLLRLKAIFPRLKVVHGLYERRSSKRISDKVVQSLFWKGLHIHKLHVSKSNSSHIPLILTTRTQVTAFEMGLLSYRTYLMLQPQLQYFIMMNYKTLQYLELNFGHIRLSAMCNPNASFRLNLLPLCNLKSLRLLFRTLSPDVAISLLECTPTTLERLELINTIASFESITEVWADNMFGMLRKFSLKHLSIIGLLPNAFSSERYHIEHVNSLILEMPFVESLDLGCGPIASMHGDLLCETTAIACMTRCHHLHCRIAKHDVPCDAFKMIAARVTGCVELRMLHCPIIKLSDHMLVFILSHARLEVPCLHAMQSELQHRCQRLEQQLGVYNHVLRQVDSQTVDS